MTVNGTYPNQKLLGMMLVAVPLNARDETTTMGDFQVHVYNITTSTTKRHQTTAVCLYMYMYNVNVHLSRVVHLTKSN